MYTVNQTNMSYGASLVVNVGFHELIAFRSNSTTAVHVFIQNEGRIEFNRECFKSEITLTSRRFLLKYLKVFR